MLKKTPGGQSQALAATHSPVVLIGIMILGMVGWRCKRKEGQAADNNINLYMDKKGGESDNEGGQVVVPKESRCDCNTFHEKGSYTAFTKFEPPSFTFSPVREWMRVDEIAAEIGDGAEGLVAMKLINRTTIAGTTRGKGNGHHGTKVEEEKREEETEL